jgi:hypothetical protein
VAEAGKHPPAELGAAYFAELMQVLKRRATPKSHANVLQHLMGYLKRDLDAGDKAELAAVIDACRREELPLIMPVTLFPTLPRGSVCRIAPAARDGCIGYFSLLLAPAGRSVYRDP